MNKIVLITGATSGIGEACAHKFAENSLNVIISGRRKERLQQVGAQLKELYGIDVFILELDVREKEQVKAAVSGLPEEWENIDVLLNNAGLALGLNIYLGKCVYKSVADTFGMKYTSIESVLN